VPEPSEPQSLNRYSWVQGSALNYKDPSGQSEVKPPLITGAGRKLRTDDLYYKREQLRVQEMSQQSQIDSRVTAIGVYHTVGGGAGCGAEVEGTPFTALVFNFRSGQLSQVTGIDLGVYAGTPRVVSVSAGSGLMLVHGASRNDQLEGVDVYYGLSAGADALGFAGFEATESRSLSFEDQNGNGLPEFINANGDIWPDRSVDPITGAPITTHQFGLEAGFNGFVNVVDVGAVGGVSVTMVNDIIPGWEWEWWPWNWE
jgi:hypothetical protein